MRPSPNVFAIVPAAGLSRRMGEPKLRMAFGDSTVLGHVIQGLTVEAALSVYVVVRKDDTAIARIAEAAGAEVVVAENDPPDMRQSVEVGLRYITDLVGLAESDAWMLCPGDCVGVTSTVTQQVASAWGDQRVAGADVVVPVHNGVRGHPALFSASLVQRLFSLNPNLGVNALLRLPGVVVSELVVDSFGVTEDVDTPEQYNAAVKRLTESEPEEGPNA